jgi:hypothetical protein
VLEDVPARDLLRELISNGSLLIKRQLNLARLEAQRDVQKERTSLKLLGVAGALGYAAALLLLLAAALGIGRALDGRYWAGALIVAAGLLFLVAVLAPLGWWRRVKRPLAKTRGEIDKEREWASSRLTT